MTSAAFLAITVIFGVLSFPEGTQSFIRKTRAFKSENIHRLPYKRSGQTFEGVEPKLALANFEPSWLFNEGDITVEEMADRLMRNRHLALDFVTSFMDTDGDRLISASEILPPSERRRR